MAQAAYDQLNEAYRAGWGDAQARFYDMMTQLSRAFNEIGGNNTDAIGSAINAMAEMLIAEPINEMDEDRLS